MTTPEAVIDKIRKCMALAESENEFEAAAALRQAQRLMQKAAGNRHPHTHRSTK